MQINFLNPRSSILFICILQGAIFAVLLFFRYFKRKKSSDFWLATLLILLCLSLVTPFIGFANVYDLNQWLTYFPFSIAYSYGICIWFYVVYLTNSKRKFASKDLLFFVPTAIYLIFRFTLFAQNLEFKDWFDENYYVPLVAPIIFVTELVWNVAFLFLSIKHYKKYRAWLDEHFSDTEKIKFDWLRNFLYVFTFVLILGAIFDFTNSFVFKLSYIQYFYFEMILAFATYYLAIAGYLRSQVIELGFLSEKELEKLKAKLQNLMHGEKPSLEPQLTLTDLSRQIGVNSAVLSYTINNGFGKNFNDFINEFRIAASIQKRLSIAPLKNSQALRQRNFTKMLR